LNVKTLDATVAVGLNVVVAPRSMPSVPSVCVAFSPATPSVIAAPLGALASWILCVGSPPSSKT
jgi:hypothetical protein